MKLTVKCDKCNWKLGKQDIYKWHNKKCPECNDCIVVDDEDLAIYKTFVELPEGLGIAKECQENSKVPKGYIKVRIDTGTMKKGNNGVHVQS